MVLMWTCTETLRSAGRWQLQAGGCEGEDPEPGLRRLQPWEHRARRPPCCSAHLADCLREDLDDLLVRCGHHALPVDLDDAVPHADAALLSDAPTHQAADLGSKECW